MTLIGWIGKDVDACSHFYLLGESSVCAGSRLLHPAPGKYVEAGIHCEECKRVLKSKWGAAAVQEARGFRRSVESFEEAEGITPERVVVNYVSYHAQALALEQVVAAVGEWGGDVDWMAVVLRAAVSGVLGVDGTGRLTRGTKGAYDPNVAGGVAPGGLLVNA